MGREDDLRASNNFGYCDIVAVVLIGWQNKTE